MRHCTLHCLIFATWALSAACGSDKAATNTNALDAADFSVQGAQAGLQSNADASSAATAGRSGGTTSPNVHALLRQKPACLQAETVGTLSSTLNANVSVDFKFDACNVGGGQSQSGNQTLEVVGNGAQGFTVTVYSDIERTHRDGDRVSITGIDPSKPTLTLSATPFDPQSTAEQEVTTILNIQEHRVRTSMAGSVVYDVEITATGSQAKETYENQALTRRVVNGTTYVQHNLVKAKSTLTSADTTWTPATCACYPTSGTLTQDLVYAADSAKPGAIVKRIYTFTQTCGQVTFDTTASTDSGTATGKGTLTFDACE